MSKGQFMDLGKIFVHVGKGNGLCVAADIARAVTVWILKYVMPFIDLCLSFGRILLNRVMFYLYWIHCFYPFRTIITFLMYNHMHLYNKKEEEEFSGGDQHKWTLIVYQIT